MPSGKKETNKTFRIDENLESWLGTQLVETGLSLADFIRTAIIIAAPLIREDPQMIRVITESFFEKRQH
jgi:hypothetical protein